MGLLVMLTLSRLVAVPVPVDQRLHKQLDHTYGSTGAISAFVTIASTGTNAGVAPGIDRATGSVSISATYASIHVARYTAGFATGYAIGNGNGYVSALLLYVGAAST